MRQIIHLFAWTLACLLGPSCAMAQTFSPQAGKCYKFSLCGFPDVTIYESLDGGVLSANYDTALRCFWEFVPTDKPDCFYIRNASSGYYMQSTKQALSTPVVMGKEPVEFYVKADATNGATKGYYYLCSTDNANYTNNATDGALGLNRSGSSASSVIVSYYVKSGRKNSYWQLVETDNLYEVHPFVSSEKVGKPSYEYTIKAKSGRYASVNEDGTLTLTDKGNEEGASWYFVGESNVKGGYVIANSRYQDKTLNLRDGLPVLSVADEPQRWYLGEETENTQSFYYFRPMETKDVPGTALRVLDDSLWLFRTVHSAFARQARIYHMPCGVLGTQYVNSIGMKGTGVLKALSYPLTRMSGSSMVTESAKPTSWYTLYTKDKATLVAGGTFTLSVALNEAPAEGTSMYVYFDWDGDGIFEMAEPIEPAQETVATITIPADAKLGNSRMRLRLTLNGLADADDEVAGQIIDAVVTVEQPQEGFVVKVVPNAVSRGTVELSDEVDRYDAGTALTATATPLGKATFLCWQEGRKVLSVNPSYPFVVDGNKTLTACFSPETDEPVLVGVDAVTRKSESVNVINNTDYIEIQTSANKCVTYLYALSGELLVKTDKLRIPTAGLTAGTYIVKVWAAGENAAVKVAVK